MQHKKLYIGLALGLIIFAGAAFYFGNSAQFKGEYTAVEVNECESIDHTNYKSLILTQEAEDYSESAATDSETTLTFLNSAKVATDAEELESAQSNADLYATSAETNADCSQAFSDAAKVKYSYANSDYNTYKEAAQSLEDSKDKLYATWQALLKAYEIYIDAEDNHYACIYTDPEHEKYGEEYECSDPYKDEVEAKSEYTDLAGISTYDGGDAVGEAEDDYNTALSKYNDFIASEDYTDAVDAYTDTVSSSNNIGNDDDDFYYEEAQSYADSALEYATLARAYSEEAQEQTISSINYGDSDALGLEVSTYSTSTTEVEIDWSSGESYTLGQWYLGTGSTEGIYIPADSSGFYVGTPSFEVPLSDYFNNIRTDVEYGNLDASGLYKTEGTGWLYILSNYDYILTVTGTPIADKESDFKALKNTAPQVALSFDSFTMGSTEYTYSKLSKYFTFDEVGYSYGGITMTSSVYACDSLSLEETESSLSSSTITYTVTSAEATAAGADFSGTLSVSTDGDGTLFKSLTNSGASISLDAASTGDFSYKNPGDGDIITASIDGETNCSTTLTIDRSGLFGDDDGTSTTPEPDPSSSLDPSSDVGTSEAEYLSLLITDGYSNGVEGISELAFSAYEDTEKVVDVVEAGTGYYEVSATTDDTFTLALSASGWYIEESYGPYTLATDIASATTEEIELSYPYMVKVTDEAGDTVSGATVSAKGDSDTTYECTEVSDGLHGCNIKIDTNLSYLVTALGYEKTLGSFSVNRTDATSYGESIIVKMTPEEADSDEEDEATDTDGDGLSDLEEINKYQTDPDSKDSDGDGLTDYEEVITYSSYDIDANSDDSDGDELSDYEEIITFETDPADDDTDGDGAEDGAEITLGRDPLTLDKSTSESDDSICSGLPFTDVAISYWGYEYICKLYDKGIVSGRTSTLYYPDSNVTRAEFLKMIMLRADQDPAYYSGLTVDKYSDVNPGDWYYNYVALADNNNDLWYPADGVWYPNDYITRGDAILLAVRIANITLYDFTSEDSSFTDFDEDSYQAYAIILGEQYEVIQGYDDGSFKPNNKITRSEAAVIVSKAEALFE